MNLIYKLLYVPLFLFVIMPIRIIQSISVILLGLRGYKFDEDTRTFERVKNER